VRSVFAGDRPRAPSSPAACGQRRQSWQSVCIQLSPRYGLDSRSRDNTWASYPGRIPISTVDGSPVPAGPQRVLVRSLWLGPRGPRRYCGWGEQLIGPVRRPRHYVLAAGVAAAVALGPCWHVHVAGITPGAVANRHLSGVSVSAWFAGMGAGPARCRAAPAVAPGYEYRRYLSQRGVDHLRRRPAGAQLAADVLSQAWRAGDQSSPEPSATTQVRGLHGAIAEPGIGLGARLSRAPHRWQSPSRSSRQAVDHCASMAGSSRLSQRPWVRNFSTYSAQRAADSHFRPVRAGQTAPSRHGQRATIPTATPQVRTRMSTSSPGWATMHRVSRRCSSVGRAAVL
jgi:hypothetical protein